MIRTARIALGFLALGPPTVASAHVKWFTDADVRQPPVAPSVLLSPIFAAVLGAAVVLVFAGFLLDGWIATRWPHLLKRGRTTDLNRPAMLTPFGADGRRTLALTQI